jgi:hypothetical protein
LLPRLLELLQLPKEIECVGMQLVLPRLLALLQLPKEMGCV